MNLLSNFNSTIEYPPMAKPMSILDIISGNKKLPPRVYNVLFNQNTKQIEIIPTEDVRFKLPERIYGDLPKYAFHFWEAFSKTNENLGVILTGEKGTGKTELS